MNINLSPSAETVQTVVHQYFAASCLDNDRKVEAMVDCFTENCLNYEPAEGSPLKGQAELRQFLTNIATLFSTVGLTEDFISINGNQAAVKWTGRGLGQNGREVTFEGIDLFEVNNAGKIQSICAYWNPVAMLAQLQQAN